MKSSRFNYLLRYKNYDIMFNTLTSKLLLLDPTLIELYKAANVNNNIDGLKGYHPIFFQKLIDGKFIIDNNVDETEEVRKIMNKIDGDESHYYLIINPTMNCNFKCWYCYESHIKSSRMSEKTIQHIISHLTNVLNKNEKIKRVTIGWFGGEPLLHFENIMLPIMRQADKIVKEKKIFLGQNITTNGFLIREEMIPHFKDYNLTTFQITLDGNHSMHDTVRFVSKNRGSYEDILSNIKLLVRSKLKVTIRINYTKATLENIEDIYDDLKDLSEDDLQYLDISFHQVWQDKNKNLNDRVDELIEFFRIRGINGRNSYIPNNLYSSCYADKKNHATINYDGNVFKCTARDFNLKNREGVLTDSGEIEWNDKFYSRMEIKLRNKPCQSCKILPLCNGGCSQVAIEAEGKDFCVYDYDEDIKREIVFRKVENLLNQEITV